MKYKISYYLIGFMLAMNTHANVTLPSMFSDRMVLQREADVLIWGWAGPFEKIEVTTSWDNNVYRDTADNHANWSVKIQTPKAGGPYEIKIRGYNEILLSDVLVGEVWLCSGQSNMEWTPSAGMEGADEAIAKADHPMIRFFQTPKKTADAPQLEASGAWKTCTPETMKYFSAIGYSFGKDLNENLEGVPIGLISASWGGSPAEVWIPGAAIENDDRLKEGAGFIGEMDWSPSKPGKAYNAMISPLTSYKIAGVIWYQGESNAANPDYYQSMFETLITTWREKWGYAFPFYFVQIAPYPYGGSDAGVKVRDAQRRVNLPHTGMVVISDIGDTTDIHPKKKMEVGERLARQALKKHYGVLDEIVEGPVFEQLTIKKEKAILSFSNAAGLYLTNDEKLFEVAAEDQVFYPASQSLKGGEVIVSSPQVKNPVYVRFAWGDTMLSNLFNEADLPASSFSTNQ
ncbi:MAG: sialate O-acetylesterase [Bacteroidota bacterium]